MELDQKAIDFMRRVKESGGTLEEATDFLRGKGYDIPAVQAQTQPQETAEENLPPSPGLLQGASRSFATEATAGLAPFIAGATNIVARGAGALAGAVVDKDPALLKQLSPTKIPEYYKEGKREYRESQKAFAQEHPIANVVGGGLGTVAGIGLLGGTVGAAAKARVGASALGQAGRLGQVAARSAGEITAFAAYEAGKGATAGEDLSAKGAGKGLLQGAEMGALFGVMGGGMQYAEPYLIKQAQKLISNPTASELLVKTFGLGVEGAAIGAIPAAVEGRLPTKGELAAGELFAVGGRGVAKAGEYVGEKAYKFANTPTKMQAQEMRARAQEIGTAQEKADTALAEEIAATRERVSLERQVGPSLMKAEERASEHRKQFSRWEKEDGLNSEKREKAAGDKLKKDLAEIDKYKRDIAEAQATEDWYAAERKQAENELETVLQDGGTKKQPAEISVEQKEIDAWMKANKKNPYATESKARRAVEREKREAAARAQGRAGLPLTERVARSAKELLSKTIQQFNWIRPVEEDLKAYEYVTGQKIAPDKNPVFRINKLRAGGEQESLLRGVVDTAKRVEKEYPGSMEGARELLEAEKRIQFLRDTDKVPTEELTKIVADYKDDKPVQEIAKAVRDLNQKALDRLYEVGRIDKATYDLWKKNDAYVPSRAEMYSETGEQIVSNNFEASFKKYEGGADLYQNPIVSSMEQVKRIDQFAELQLAKKEYLEAAQKIGRATKAKTIEDYKGGPVNFKKDSQIVVWENGVPEIWNVPKRVADYFNPMPKPAEGKMMKFVKALAAMPLKFYKGGTTAASLGFAESNIPRDVTGAIIGSEYGGNIGAGMWASSAKELVNGAPIVDAFQKEFGGQTLRNIEQLPGMAEDNINKFVSLYESANKSTKEGTAANVIMRMFTTALPNAAKKLSSITSGATKKGFDMLSYAGNLSEETTRLSVFKSVLQGMAKNDAQYELWLKQPNLIPKDVLAKAGNEAREVTLNFRRQMAPWVEGANKYFLPYFKPAILGAMRGFTMLSNPEIAPRAWRYIVNLGIAQGLITGKIVGGKQLEDLDSINNEIAGKNLVIKGKNDRYYTIPLAQEIAPLVKMFAGVTEKIYRWATKQQREDIGRETVQAMKDLVENYTPAVGYLVQPSNFALGGPIPKTILEESVNKDFFTRTPIESSAQKDRPAYMRKTKNTPALTIALSKTLARNGIEISPLRLRHITVGLTSNVGKELFAVTDSLLSHFGKGPLRSKKEITDSPYTRRLVADLTAPYNQYAQDANDIIERAKQGNKAIEMGDPEDWSEKQKKQYEMHYEIYELIKDDVKALQNLSKERAKTERELDEEATYIQQKRRNGEISEAEFKKQWRELEYELKAYTEEQTLEERMYQLDIIDAAKQIKEDYKKAP